MKNLKNLFVIALVFTVCACSKKDDDGDGGNPAQAEFTATIKGGSFGDNYESKLGFYSSDYSNDNSLTLAITDENTNIVRFFLNETGGFGSGITKVIGNKDSNGFITNVVIRDQAAQVTYDATIGEINILENRENPDSEDGRLISGNFTITATSGVGPTITMMGTFKDFAY
ncbi:hypothetical protein [Rasiella sp. SM2506]|uniref:hypothetical protein n=1 Tax=Rasiella sp. SM2506 TaxID=3423914 RepID=UPI003D79130D